ncbi:hypothetical protein ES703_107800 [subsurface metagenome]
MFQVGGEFHADLGHAATASHNHIFKYASGDHAGGADNGMIRSTTKRPNIVARCIHAATHFGHGLGHAAAAAIIPVPYGCFRAIQNKINICWSYPSSFEKMEHGQRPGSLGYQVFHKNQGLQRIVVIVVTPQRPHKLTLEIDGHGSTLRNDFPYFFRGLTFT